ncbi:hypothetical protein [Cellulosimicrobium sp. Marseille-Q4280]|uniref:hypothetical protein n=1 Tax=Cellulosimicrobium sp. Marseille-Q4280 TaxID=2937992 RepID=UPI00203B26AD|nr:hypothetical protein [Cellulosimicrobium sp. Marseille-Q4280]
MDIVIRVVTLAVAFFVADLAHSALKRRKLDKYDRTVGKEALAPAEARALADEAMTSGEHLGLLRLAIMIALATTVGLLTGI